MKKLLLILFFFPLIVISQSESIYEDFSRMSQKELRIARNTVYAKYGREFKSNDLREYFSSTIWYKVNSSYNDGMLTKKDKELIRVIKVWEKSDLIWSSKVDLDGDSKIDYCYGFVVNNEIIIVINQSVNLYNLNWPRHNYWDDVRIEVVDINQKDNNKEIWISQYDKNEEDPNRENIFISKNKNNIVSSFPETAYGYNSGTVSFLRNGKVIIDVAQCPYWIRKYELIDYKLKLIGEDKGEEPPEGCPACFAAGSKVSKDKNGFILIEDLSIGDTILSYDVKTNKYQHSIVLDLVSVKHKNLVELYFEHDTIISTMDHPYFVFNKGWSSFDNVSTEFNYKNYDKVFSISTGDYFMLYNGLKIKLLGFSYLKEEKQTYTITKLSSGDTFFVNGVLVGVEDIRDVFSNHFD